MPQLFVLSGPDVGKSFEIEKDASVGRSPDCVVVLRDSSISRRHAHFERNGPQWFIVDDGSRNGIAADGAKKKRIELADMQEFSIGEILVRFRASAPAVTAPAPVGPVATPRAVPPPAGEDDDELVLGGGDDEIQLDFKDEPPRRTVAQPAAPPAPRVPKPEIAATSFAQRAEPPRMGASMLDTGFGPARGLAGDTLSRRKPGAGDRVLQFNKLENKRGVGGTDLAQLPLWMRLGAYLLVAALAGALAYFAFFGTSKLKQRIGGDPANDAEVGDEAK